MLKRTAYSFEVCDSLIVFFIIVPAMIVNGPNDTEVQQGHNVILGCAAHGHPTPKFAWSFGLQESRPLTGDPRMIVLPGGSLLIQNAKMSDAGVYKCMASNNAGTDTTEAVLRVKGMLITSFESILCAIISLIIL